MERTIRVNIAQPLEDRSGGAGGGGEFNAAGHPEVRLYIGGMNVDTMTPEQVTKLFEEYGRVSDCHVPTDFQSGRPRGYAFVTMRAENAKLACQAINETELDGHRVCVTESRDKKKSGGGGPRVNGMAGRKKVLYVGGIPVVETAPDIFALKDRVRTLFSHYGEVSDCFVPTEYESGRPRGFAFVTMAADDADEACQQLDNTQQFGGRTLRVNESRAKANNRDGSGGEHGGRGGGYDRGGGGGSGYDRRGDGGGRRGGGYNDRGGGGGGGYDDNW
mmetsp:Transcript_245/g.291  ORF Transcript_245/g.291 Transcript_245/m.291 type:complete len:275 (+) Transcript_245:1-825(+)